MKIFWTKEALLRLQEIEEYISRDNPVAAIEFVDKLISVAQSIVDHPEKGRIVPELSIEKIREALIKIEVSLTCTVGNCQSIFGVCS